MILYNVTVGIDKSAEKEWLIWMSENHIPKIMGIGIFNDCKVYRVLSHTEEGTSSYSIQYFCDSLDKMETYFNEYAQPLADEHREKFKDRHVAFRTLLEEIT